jgi:hypothetical protein
VLLDQAPDSQSGMSAAPEAVAALPAGLRQLHGLAAALTSATDLPADLRVVVTVPTLRLGGAVAALGAAGVELDCTGCGHTQLEPGARVTGWATGRFTDSRLMSLTDDELCFAGIRLRGNRDSVHRLPDDFPDRPDARLTDDVRTAVAGALGCADPVAGQRLSATCAHPVVVAGEPSAFRDDATALAAAPSLHARARLHHGTRLRDWFRHPVLTVGSLPEPEELPWAAGVVPRLLVIAGSAAWTASSRRLWPDVPVLALLARRSPAACGVTTMISASGWAMPAQLPAELDRWATPGAGLEIARLLEPAAACDGEDLW